MSGPYRLKNAKMMITMTEHTRPPLKHPQGHCWQVMTHSDDPMRSIRRLETPGQCRAWLSKLAEMDAADEYREAVAQRYKEVRE